jgi:WhiB family redox-sensing transcriptional regulator
MGAPNLRGHGIQYGGWETRGEPVSLDWRREAACTAYPNVWWFPGATEKATKNALQICRGCVVRAECLDYAMNDRYARDNGIWAGTTPQERKNLKPEAA